MKKFIAIGLSVVLLLTGIVPTFAMYSPPSRVTPTKEDIAVGENFFKNLKWDLSNVENNQIGLTIPKMSNNYIVAIVQWNLEDNNYIVGGRGFYQGSGGVKVTKDINQKLKTGYRFMLANDDTSALIALEFYTYSKGDTVIKYISFEDRRFPMLDENGNIEYWTDDLGNRINEEGASFDLKNHNPHRSAFKDIRSDFWGFNDINTMAGSGFIKGYPDGSFKPNNKITRAEFMVMLGNVLKNKWASGGSYNHNGEKESISSSHWAYNAVNNTFKYFHENDILYIFGDDFKPDQYTTKEEVVAVLASVLSVHKNFQKEPTGNISLSDIQTSKFPESLLFSVKQNLVTGYPDGTFKPQNSITRAEITAVMVRMIEKL